MDGYTQGHVERNTMTFYFVYPKPSIFVPDTEKCPSSWLIYLRYETKKFLKNKEKRLDYIGSDDGNEIDLYYHPYHVTGDNERFLCKIFRSGRG